MHARTGGPFLRDPEHSQEPAVWSRNALSKMGGGTWNSETFTELTDTFTLAYAPTNGSEFVFRNGVLESGYTLLGVTLTLASALSGSDVLTVRYQYLA
jgi:hypothetical protein